MLNIGRYEQEMEAAILAEPPISDPHLAVLETLELPGDDGEPMENERERTQIDLFLDGLNQHWQDRADFYAAGNMFVYYSITQARRVLEEINTDALPRTAFRGPDIFVVLGVDGSYRRQKWIVWEEDGRYPDVIFELLSPTTRKRDLGQKKRLYEQTFHTQEYFCFDYLDPESGDALQGWRLDAQGLYQPIEPDTRGWLWSEVLDLWVGRWKGVFLRDATVWMRLYTPDGELVLTDGEASRQLADQEAQRAERLAAQLRALGIEPKHA
jgi:Uma2 family endonuclease